MEELRDAWFEVPDLAAQKQIAEQMQLRAFETVPFYPLGMVYIPTAVQTDITGMLEGFPIFWNVRRA
jgi:peptide/nickel transport system substrate-binding protein